MSDCTDPIRQENDPGESRLFNEDLDFIFNYDIKYRFVRYTALTYALTRGPVLGPSSDYDPFGKAAIDSNGGIQFQG